MSYVKLNNKNCDCAVLWKKYEDSRKKQPEKHDTQKMKRKILTKH